jgi:hypothetical protein
MVRITKMIAIESPTGLLFFTETDSQEILDGKEWGVKSNGIT